MGPTNSQSIRPLPESVYDFYLQVVNLSVTCATSGSQRREECRLTVPYTLITSPTCVTGVVSPQNIRVTSFHIENYIQVGIDPAAWHHEVWRVMTNGDPEGRIFLSYPHANNGFFFLLTTVFIYLSIYLIIYFKISFQKALNTVRCNFT